MAGGESDRREYPRIRCSLPVRYKFLSTTIKDPALDSIFDGATQNLSVAGMLLVGPINNLDWVKDLLLGRINVGVNISVPNIPFPVKGLCKLSWVEGRDEEAISFRLGLRFVELPGDHRKALSDFLIREPQI